MLQCFILFIADIASVWRQYNDFRHQSGPLRCIPDQRPHGGKFCRTNVPVLSSAGQYENQAPTSDLQETIARAEAVSPTLQQLQPLLDSYVEDWSTSNGEIPGDHFSWVLRDAVQDSGFPRMPSVHRPLRQRSL